MAVGLDEPGLQGLVARDAHGVPIEAKQDREVELHQLVEMRRLTQDRAVIVEGANRPSP